MIIAVANEKGGVGKSTIASNIAIGLTLLDCKVAVLDADPQKSITNFLDRRESQKDTMDIAAYQKTGNLNNTIQSICSNCDYLVIDTGGRDSSEMRSAIVQSDLVVVPLQASVADVETLPPMLDIISQAKSMKGDIKTLIVLNNAPTNSFSTEVVDSKQSIDEYAVAIELQDVIFLPVLKNRKIYRTAFANGQGVLEMQDNKAQHEMHMLIKAIASALSSDA